MTVARRHHYLPRCYLKGFAKPRKHGASHHVHVVDRSGKTFTTNIINVAAEKDFNRIEVEGHPPDAIEQGLSKFEGKLGPALVRILKSRSLKDQDDRLLLLNLIGLASIRNPTHRENFRSVEEQVAYMVMDLATASKERWEGQVEQIKASGYAPNHDVPYEKLRKAVEDKAFRIVVPTERHIALEMSVLDTILKTLLKRKWLTLLAPEGSAGFITSDYPVCLMFSDPKMRGRFHGPGHGLTGTEIIFPVGRRMAIVGAFEIETEKTIMLDEDGVAGINGALVCYADRQVYAADVSFSYSRQYTEKPRSGASLVRDTDFLKGRQEEE